MPKYILKPIVFEAVQWTPTTKHEAVTLHAMHRVAGGNICQECHQFDRLHGFIDHGGNTKPTRVCPGDYVVTHPNGGVYACKPEDFEKTCVPYEEGTALMAGKS